MEFKVELGIEEMNLVKLAKSHNVNVSQGTLAEIGDIFLGKIKL